MGKNNALDNLKKAEAEAAKKAANEPDPCLISLTKDGETLKAHPNQVALWMEQGWVVSEDEAPAEDAE